MPARCPGGGWDGFVVEVGWCLAEPMVVIFVYMLACIRSIASTPYVFSGHLTSFRLANFRSATKRIGLPESLSICCNPLDLRVDMGEYFPYPGPCDRTKASTVLPGGDVILLYRQ